MGNAVLRQNVSTALRPVSLFLAGWRQTAPAIRLGYVTHNRHSDNNMTTKEKTRLSFLHTKRQICLCTCQEVIQVESLHITTHYYPQH